MEDANNELAELKAQSSIAQDVSAENERLRELLDLKESNAGSWNMVAASVSGREIDNWYERLLINKGSADGIEENMLLSRRRTGGKNCQCDGEHFGGAVDH